MSGMIVAPQPEAVEQGARILAKNKRVGMWEKFEYTFNLTDEHLTMDDPDSPLGAKYNIHP